MKRTIVLVWTDYEQCEVFASEKDAHTFCCNEYGPDKRVWPALEMRALSTTHKAKVKLYYAVAWWPDWTYGQPPDEPCVTSQYGTAEGMGTEGINYRSTGKTVARAEQAAIQQAKNARPIYKFEQSSMTTSGLLPVFVNANFTGTVGV